MAQYCKECNKNIKRENNKLALAGKNTYTDGRSMYCDSCNSTQNLVAKYKNNLTILGKCKHANRKKERHHPDYGKPLEVFLLCPPCHGFEHKIINEYSFFEFGFSANPNQTEISKFLGVSKATLSQVRAGNQEFGKQNGIRIEEKTGLPKE